MKTSQKSLEGGVKRKHKPLLLAKVNASLYVSAARPSLNYAKRLAKPMYTLRESSSVQAPFCLIGSCQ